jgi:hypothetical protein
VRRKIDEMHRKVSQIDDACMLITPMSVPASLDDALPVSSDRQRSLAGFYFECNDNNSYYKSHHRY